MEGRATTFFSEVLGLVVPTVLIWRESGMSTMTGGRRRSKGRSLISLRCLWLGSYLDRSKEIDEVEGRARAFWGGPWSRGAVSRWGLIWRERSEDVDKVDGRARAFSGEVLGLVVLSGLGVFP